MRVTHSAWNIVSTRYTSHLIRLQTPLFSFSSYTYSNLPCLLKSKLPNYFKENSTEVFVKFQLFLSLLNQRRIYISSGYLLFYKIKNTRLMNHTNANNALAFEAKLNQSTKPNVLMSYLNFRIVVNF